MSGGLELAHRRPVQLQTMSIVDEAIEDGVCDGRVCDRLVPVIDRQLAGDECGAAVVPVIDKLQEIAALIGRERREAPIVEDQQLDTRERAQQAHMATITARERKASNSRGTR